MTDLLPWFLVSPSTWRESYLRTGPTPREWESLEVALKKKKPTWQDDWSFAWGSFYRRWCCWLYLESSENEMKAADTQFDNDTNKMSRLEISCLVSAILRLFAAQSCCAAIQSSQDVCFVSHCEQQFSDYKSCCSLNNIIFHNYLILLLNLEVWKKYYLLPFAKKTPQPSSPCFFTQKYKLRSHNISLSFFGGRIRWQPTNRASRWSWDSRWGPTLMAKSTQPPKDRPPPSEKTMALLFGNTNWD